MVTEGMGCKKWMILWPQIKDTENIHGEAKPNKHWSKSTIPTTLLHNISNFAHIHFLPSYCKVIDESYNDYATPLY